MQFERIAFLYGVGTVGGALAITAQWILKELAGGGLALTTTQPKLDAYYMPMVWGGLWALLYLIPMRIKPIYKALIFFWAPALTYMALRSGGWSKVQELIMPDRLLRQDMLLVLIVYFVFWGLLTSKLATREQG